MFLHKQSRPNLIELAFAFWISLAENSVRVLSGGIFPSLFLPANCLSFHIFLAKCLDVRRVSVCGVDDLFRRQTVLDPLAD